MTKQVGRKSALACIFVIVVSGCTSQPKTELTEAKPSTVAELAAAKCLEASKEVRKFEADEKSAVELQQINALQKKKFMETVAQLYDSEKISIKDLNLVESYASYDFNYENKEKSTNDGSSKVVGPPENPNSLIDHLNDSVNLGKLFDNWIDLGLIEPYLFKSVVDRGNALAARVPRADKIILDNPECFSESRVSLVKSIARFRSPEKSNWGRVKTGSELAAFLD
jgi:hypothetical protein